MSPLGLARPAFAQAGAPTTTAPEAEAITFRFAWTPGQNLRQRIESRSFGTIQMTEFLPAIKFSQSFSHDVNSVCRSLRPEGGAIVDMRMANIAMKMSAGKMQLDYDARTFKPDQEQQEYTRIVGRLLSAFEGAQFTVTLDGTGKTIAVEGLGEAVRKALAALPDDLTGKGSSALAGQIFDQIAGMMDDEKMTQQMQSYYRMIPDHGRPVRIGEIWSHAWQMELPMIGSKLDARGDYELLGVETLKGRRCAKIRIKETFTMANRPKPDTGPATQPSDPAQILANMDLNVTTEGGDGIAYWDYEQGVLVRLRQTMKMNIQAQPPTPEASSTQPAPAMKMTQKLQTAVKVDLLDDAETQPVEESAATSPDAEP